LVRVGRATRRGPAAREIFVVQRVNRLPDQPVETADPFDRVARNSLMLVRGLRSAQVGDLFQVAVDHVIERAEVVALLFNVSDIASSLAQIERLLEEDDGEEEADGS
jgi:hypothetical protein